MGGGALSQVQFVPCIQKGFRTYSPQDAAERQKIIDFEKNISFGVDIDKNGMVTAK
jgi:hypothetical protein